MYIKHPGTEDYSLQAADVTSPYSYPYIDPKYVDSEYSFKLVAIPNDEKKNLLASESEISVDTPEAWVDTAAPSADSIKVALVPNTLNNYTLSFPVDAGFAYSAKLVEATAAATEDAKDLFAGENSTYTPVTYDYWYSSTYTPNEIENYDWDNDYNSPKNENLRAKGNLEYRISLLSGSDTTYALNTSDGDTAAAIAALTTTYNSANIAAVEAIVDAWNTANEPTVSGEADVNTDDFAAAIMAYDKMSSYNRYQGSYIDRSRDPYSSLGLVYSDGAAYITELDDDDNVVSPVVSTSLVPQDSGVEYRVVLKMTPKNTQVATTKYILSSATFKFDATGIVSTPSTAGVSVVDSSATKRVLKFYADKYNGTEIAGTNYRIYQVLTTYTQDSEGVDLGSTTTVAKLGTASKDADYDTTDKDNVRYEYEFSINAASKTEAYSYTWFVVTTSQNGDAVWTYIGNDFVDFKN